MRLGIYGGTFNPPHLGHVNIVNYAYRLLDLDEVLIVPAGMPYMKNQKELVSTEHRLKMCEIFSMYNPSFSVSDIECKRSGPSYTIDTIREIKSKRPNDDIYLILGTDAFIQLKEWNNVSELVDLVIFAVFDRGDCGYADYLCAHNNLTRAILKKEVTSVFIEAQKIKVPFLFNDAIYDKYDVSSSDIRKRIREGRPYKFLLPSDVARYIEVNDLYKE